MKRLNMSARLSCKLMRIENGVERRVLQFVGDYDPDKDHLYDESGLRLDFRGVLNQHAVYFTELSDTQIESIKATFNQTCCWGASLGHPDYT